MKKIVIYALLLGVVLLMPVRGEDVGKLLPVELIKIYMVEETLVIDTDLGVTGMGATVEEAVVNLKDTASGIIFLDTADYLLVDETAKHAVPAIGSYLKPSVRICEVQGEIELKKASEFLSVHQPAGRLKDHRGENGAEILVMENGKMILKEK